MKRKLYMAIYFDVKFRPLSDKPAMINLTNNNSTCPITPIDLNNEYQEKR